MYNVQHMLAKNVSKVLFEKKCYHSLLFAITCLPSIVVDCYSPLKDSIIAGLSDDIYYVRPFIAASVMHHSCVCLSVALSSIVKVYIGHIGISPT